MKFLYKFNYIYILSPKQIIYNLLKLNNYNTGYKMNKIFSHFKYIKSSRFKLHNYQFSSHKKLEKLYS